MDSSFSNFYLNLEDSEDYSNTSYYENSQFFSSSSQIPVTESTQNLQNIEKQSRSNKWDAAEDVALMSAWCMVSTDRIRGKNQKKKSLWAEVKKLYDATHAENTEKIGMRNEDQMKGRFKRFNQNAQKWVGAYQEAYRHMTSGMSLKDVESEAHKIYEQEVKTKFNDYVVFNEVMCKHPKWELQLHRDTTRSRPEREVEDGESGGSTKRSRTTEKGGYSNPETPNSGNSTIQRPMGRDEAKKKGKVSNSLCEELRALRITRDSEIEFFKRKLDIEQEKLNIEQEKQRNREEREMKKMQLVHLNTLLQKEHLSAAEEDMKNFLISKYYGN